MPACTTRAVVEPPTEGFMHAPACPSVLEQVSRALWQAATQHIGDECHTDGPDDAKNSQRISVAGVAAVAHGAAAHQLPADRPQKRKAPDGDGGVPELPPGRLRAVASSGGACAALPALPGEPHAAEARAALNTGKSAAGRQLQVRDDSRQREDTPQTEKPVMQRAAAMASAADAAAAAPSGVPSTPTALSAEGQPAAAHTVPDDVGSRSDLVMAHDGGGGDGCCVDFSAPSRGDPGSRAGDQSSGVRSDLETPLNVYAGSGRQRAMRSVKEIETETPAQPGRAHSPGGALPAPSAPAAAAAAGSDGNRSPPSITTALGAAEVAVERQAGPEPGTATTLSPSRKPQKRVNYCNFCAIHGVVSVASTAHTQDCYYATHCFCYPCAKLGIRNRTHGEARKRRLAAEAAKAAGLTSARPDAGPRVSCPVP